MKQASTTIQKKLNLEGVDLELRQTTTVENRKKNVARRVPLYHLVR